MHVKGHGQSGFSLIEALIAMLVLSFGLVSLAIMASRAVLYSDNAATHSQAVELAYDLADSLRANRAARTDYAIDFEQTVTAPSDCSSAICGPAAFASRDLSDWKRRLAETLPGGDGEIELDADTVTVKVRWLSREETISYELQVRG